MKQSTIDAIKAEWERAKKQYPGNEHQLAALFEEVGELAQALIDHSRGKVSSSKVFEEAVQVATVAIAVAEEGSQEFPRYPTDEYVTQIIRSEKAYIGVNLWDDYYDDGYVPEGESQKTFMYVEDYNMRPQDKTQILKDVWELLGLYHFDEGLKEIYLSEKPKDIVSVKLNFIGLTHASRESLMGWLERQPTMYYRGRPLKFYSES